MAMNIEQRLEQSAKSIEQSSQKAHDFAEKDTTIQTCAGSRDSLPKVSRIWQENFARQFNKHATEFQERFALSQQSLPWQAGITISDSLQRYHIGVQGEEGYKEFLPNPLKLPFETAATLADDLTQDRWLENGVPNKHWTESKVASALEKSLGMNARIWPKDRDLQVGDMIPAPGDTADGLPITHLMLNGNSKWIGLSDEVDFSNKVVSSFTDYEIFFSDGSMSPLLDNAARLTRAVTFDMFGADPKGVIFPTAAALLVNTSLQPIINQASDSTEAIQKAIEYCAPYEWAGSISATKSSFRTRASIIGNGNYRVTDSIKLNPFIKIESSSRGGFFSNGSGLGIWGDFSDKTKYLLDTAPMNTAGERPLGQSYSRGAWDNSEVAGCMGFSLLGINAQMISGVAKGILNRQVAQESVVKYCRLGSSMNYEGVRSEVCWGGELSQNNVVGAAYSIRNGNDVTTDDQQNNYCSILGSKPSPSDYSYVPWPNADLQDRSACIISRFADPHVCNNTCEGAEIGIAALSGNIADDGGYYEGIKEYVYASHTANILAQPEWIFCPSANLVYLRGSSVNRTTIDLTACNEMNLAGIGLIENIPVGLTIKGAQRILNLQYSSRVEYYDIAYNNILNIYLSSLGSDSNTGFSSSRPVQTLQAALERCKVGVLNKINVVSGSGNVTTKYSYKNGNTSSYTEEFLDVVINLNGVSVLVGNSFNETHCMPMKDSRVTIKNGVIDLSGASSSLDYRNFLRAKNGAVHYNLESVSVVGSGKALFGTQANASGHAVICMKSVTLGASLQFTISSGSQTSFSWIETSVGVTNNGAVIGGAAAGKIYSSTF
ncbi:hypothetical protein ACYAPA_003689 [Vibrio mimicus]